MRRTTISTANKLAQKLRHSRSIRTLGLSRKMEEVAAVANISRAIYEKPLKWKVVVLSIGALFFSSNAVSALFIQDNLIETSFLDEEELVDFQPTGSSGDGFLVKPALQTADGERMGVSDILLYTVKSGDTISRIAARFNISSDTILAANNLSTGSIIRQGQELIILPVDGLTYKIQKDDTIDKIAKKYNVDKNAIIAQNNLKSDTLPMGKDLIIPGAKRVIIDPTIAQVSTTNKGKSRYASLNFNPSDKNVKKPPIVSDDTGGFDGQLVWPVSGGGRISQRYSSRHPATDITYGGSTKYPSILAADSGVVVQAETSGWNGGYGDVIVIDHGGGIKTRYAHNSEVYVSVGDNVRRGQVISKMGNTGRVYGKTGIHLHFEVIVRGKRVNPLLYY